MTKLGQESYDINLERPVNLAKKEKQIFDERQFISQLTPYERWAAGNPPSAVVVYLYI